MADSTFDRVGPWLGVVAVVVTFGGIVLAIAASPAFAWTENALSNLGDAGDPAGTATTELLFNGGLILGGLFGIGFGVWLASRMETLVRRIGSGIFVVAMAAMGGVGVFPQDGPYHLQVAVGFYTLFSVAALIVALGQLLDRRWWPGLVSIVAGGGNLLTWFVWIQSGGIEQPGLAIPETIGALLVAAWTVVMVSHYGDLRIGIEAVRRALSG